MGGGKLLSFGSLRMALVALVFVLAGLNACKKEMVSEVVSDVRKESLGVNDRDGNGSAALDLAAFKEVEDSSYTAIGRTLFEYIAFQANRVSPSELIPAEVRQELMPEILAVKGRYASVESMEQAINIAVANNSPEFNSYGELQFYTNFMQSVINDASAMQNFGTFWFYLKNREQNIEASAAYSTKEKQILKTASAIIRYYVKAAYQNGEFSEVTVEIDGIGNMQGADAINAIKQAAESKGEQCVFGLKLSCLVEKLAPKIAGLLLTWGITGGVGAVKIAISVLELLISGSFSNFCVCKSPASPPCFKVTGSSVSADDCSLTQSVLLTSNGNAYLGTYEWQIVSGGEFIIGNTGRLIAITTVPTLKVRQFDPNVPVVFETFTKCGDVASVKIHTIDMYYALKQGVMFILGPNPAKEFTLIWYYIAGTALTNANNTNFIMSLNNPPNLQIGIIQESTPTSCKVVWRETTGWGTPPGEVNGYARNTCFIGRDVTAKLLVWVQPRNH